MTGDGGLTFRASQIGKKMFSTSKILSKEQIEDLQKNPFFDKYAEKIAKLQKYVEVIVGGIMLKIKFQEESRGVFSQN